MKRLKTIVPCLDEPANVKPSTQPSTKRTLKIETEKSANGGITQKQKSSSSSEVGGDREPRKAIEQVGGVYSGSIALCYQSTPNINHVIDKRVVRMAYRHD